MCLNNKDEREVKSMIYIDKSLQYPVEKRFLTENSVYCMVIPEKHEISEIT